MKKLLLIELNEVNFEIVSTYIDHGANLPGFEKLLKMKGIQTSSEDLYEYLEPWIQWPSIHTGLTFREHRIFRLGDAVHAQHEHIFEAIEKIGFHVGAISPMNAPNNTRAPAYFIPDPWTSTSSDGHWASRLLTRVMRQAVNDNAQSKLTVQTIVCLCLCFLNYIPLKKYASFISLALQTIRKPWRKALFLDRFLWEVHTALLASKKPDFSAIFLNAGAHIQHHYLLNANQIQVDRLHNPEWYVPVGADPVLEMLEIYSEMLLDLNGDYEVLLATGLSQVPYLDPEFYYRLKNHGEFLQLLGVKFLSVQPRMTRDFVIEFESERDAVIAEAQLSQVLIDGTDRMFGEIDNRGLSLFVALTHSKEICEATTVKSDKSSYSVADFVTFVAIKNGAHTGKGYAFFSEGIEPFAPPQGAHVKHLNTTIKDFFTKRSSAVGYS